MGLHADTTLQTPSGPVRIAEIYDRHVRNPGHSEIVFIWTGSRLFFSEVHSPRLLGEEQIFDVELDDGAIVRVSPSTHFVLKNGQRKTAPGLRPGDSLLPLYLDVDYHGYPAYRIPGRDVKRKIYRLMGEWKAGRPLPRGTEVRHIDGDKLNYHPDNLDVKFNARSKKRRRKNKLGKAYQDAQALLQECADASPLLAEIAEKRTHGNHKVVRISPGRMSEVFTASVRSEGSVSVSGVFLELPA